MRFSAALFVLLLFTWSSSAHAEEREAPRYPLPAHGILALPLFLSPGFVTTFGNDHARGSIGAELSLDLLLREDVKQGASHELVAGMPGVGIYSRAELANDNAARAAFGMQMHAAILGLEAGYAYATSFEGRAHVHSLQMTPYVSLALVYVGAQILIPVSERSAPAAMGIVGIKIPLSISKGVDMPTLPLGAG